MVDESGMERAVKLLLYIQARQDLAASPCSRNRRLAHFQALAFARNAACLHPIQ